MMINQHIQLLKITNLKLTILLFKQQKQFLVMIKDEQSLQRMNFLIQAARIYQQSFPEYSSHFLYDFMQLSEKKMIRVDKQLKKKINKKTFSFRKEAKILSQFIDKNEQKIIEMQMINEGSQNVEKMTANK